MDLQYFKDLAQESAAMVGGPQGLTMPASIDLSESDDTLRVNGLIRASADDGREFPYDFILRASVLSQSGSTVRTTLDERFTSAARAFFSHRSKTSW